MLTQDMWWTETALHLQHKNSNWKFCVVNVMQFLFITSLQFSSSAMINFACEMKTQPQFNFAVIKIVTLRAVKKLQTSLQMRYSSQGPLSPFLLTWINFNPSMDVMFRSLSLWFILLLSQPGIPGVTLCFCTGSYAAATGRRFLSRR